MFIAVLFAIAKIQKKPKKPSIDDWIKNMWGGVCVCMYIYIWASLVAQLVKNLPAMQETWVQSLDWEDALEDGKATHSNVLA